MSVDRINPWLGLSSYEESMVSGENARYKFCGRSKAINEIFYKIENNTITTLYGKSGIGKTSILQAGLFPKLKADGYFPIIIRLSTEDDGKSYAQTIVEHLYKLIGGQEDKELNESYPDSSSNTFLRNLLSEIGCSTEVYPIIVLDQFEELFYKDKSKLHTLLKQIYALVDDSYSADESTSDAYANCRIVLSLREDDLFHLEDCIDTLRLYEIKFNRHRLLELGEGDAREVILEPGNGIIDDDSKEEIARTIIQRSTDEAGYINTTILSLVCSRIFDSLPDTSCIITKQHVETVLNKSDNDVIVSFYSEIQSKHKEISAEQWSFIEDELITKEGRRKSVLESEFYDVIPEAKSSFLFEGKESILRFATFGTQKERHVEVIHDLLADSIRKSKDERKLRETKRRQRKRNVIILAVGSIVLFICLALLFICVYISNLNKRVQMREAEIISFAVDKRLEKGNITSAIRLILQVDHNNKAGSYPILAEKALRKVFGSYKDGINNSVFDHAIGVVKSEICDNDTYLLVLTQDKQLRVWDILSGSDVTPILLKEYGGINYAEFCKDGKYIMTASDDKTVRIWALNGDSNFICHTSTYPVYYATFSPQGTYLACCMSSKNEVLILSAKTMEVIGAINHNAWISSVEFSNDEQCVITSSDDGIAKLHNIINDTLLKVDVPIKHNKYIRKSSFSKNGRFVATASGDSTAKIWELPFCKEVKTVKHTAPVYCVDFSPIKDNYLLTTTWNRSSIFTDIITEKDTLFSSIERSNRTSYTWLHEYSAFSDNGKYMAVISGDNKVSVYELTEDGIGPECNTIECNGVVSALDLSRDGQLVVIGLTNGQVQLCNIDSTNKYAEIDLDNYKFRNERDSLISKARIMFEKIGEQPSIETIGISPKRGYVTAKSSNDSILLLGNLKNGNVYRLIFPKSLGNYFDYSHVRINYSRDEKFVSVYYDSLHCIWQIRPFDEKIRTFITTNDEKGLLSFSADSRYVFYINEDRDENDDKQFNIHKLNLNSGRETVYKQIKNVKSIDFMESSYCGNYIVTLIRHTLGYSMGEWGEVCIWDIESNKNIVKGKLQYHEDISSISLSPISNYILTTAVKDNYSTVRIWDIVSSTEISTETLRKKGWCKFIFSQDGKYILDAYDDNLSIMCNFPSINEIIDEIYSNKKHEWEVSSDEDRQILSLFR